MVKSEAEKGDLTALEKNTQFEVGEIADRNKGLMGALQDCAEILCGKEVNVAIPEPGSIDFENDKSANIIVDKLDNAKE